ncbi:uncharacterized protein YuzB (UPF0349 family) [Anaerosolibacter carboniphilus]|uniref:Uncharacterized protein YuzB (UPF0349 family) n=1 Tax=Anaerosolibacter carboniphilus TaxID=1417629 RepID=A0A841L8L9_9FIRM|nr:DUF1450 domain-containing protein [Anaerosolibacter carboniphilus]MBB6218605.1 uncharacterized protein YuzB (UPF0349 family) [Anaerosolibacter carboniphilus]
MAEVKFCENNFGHGTDDIAERLKNEGISVEIEPCLGYCGDCAVGPFALVDDEFVQADSPEELYEKIKEQM